MEILKANDGAAERFIVNTHTYIKVWDYGKKHILVHLKMNKDYWTWVEVFPGGITDVSEQSYKSFEEAINKAVNNPYCTIYNFETCSEMAKHWDDIKYIDTITTTFKDKKNV